MASLTGNFFVLAQNTKTSKYFVLVYKSYSPNVNSLYKAVPVTAVKKLDWNLFIDISAEGDQTLDYCILTVGNYSYAIRAPLDPAILLTPGELYPYDRYTLEVDFAYQVISLDLASHVIKEKAILVNIQNDVYQDNFAIQTSGIDKLTESNRNPDTGNWEFDTSQWFYGPVLGLQMICQDCVNGPSGKEII